MTCIFICTMTCHILTQNRLKPLQHSVFSLTEGQVHTALSFQCLPWMHFIWFCGTGIKFVDFLLNLCADITRFTKKIGFDWSWEQAAERFVILITISASNNFYFEILILLFAASNIWQSSNRKVCFAQLCHNSLKWRFGLIPKMRS